MRSKIMMVRVLLCVLFISVVLNAWGEESGDMGRERLSNKSGEVTIPDSMEIIKKGDVNVIVPKGQKLIKDSNFFVTENPDEYASRKFIESEERVDKLEKELEMMKGSLEELKKIVEDMRQVKDSDSK